MRSIVVIVGGVLLFAAPAQAHFELQAPVAYSEQDAVGGPQKSPPCGQIDTNDPLVPTNAVNTLMEGSMMTVTINELIPHPGHYRVSLAQDLASLPIDAAVTVGATACGSAAVEATPTLPILADNLFVHTSAFSAPQTTMVQLPAGMTCTNCIVQVTEFMSDHPLNPQGGCFYHHCAMVNIVANAPPIDAGLTTADGGGTTAKSGGCAAQGSFASGGLLALGVATVLARRRRRSAGRRI